ncbi:MAG: metallophosphoesterase family protein [Actinomycetota bacterium]
MRFRRSRARAALAPPDDAAGPAPVARVAATADLHFSHHDVGRLAPRLERMQGAADLLLVAGDLTEEGDPWEAALVGRELRAARVPVIAVLGNHDHAQGRARQVAAALESNGVRILRGDGMVIEAGTARVGIAGVTGSGGGFPGGSAHLEAGPMKEVVAFTSDEAHRLETSLGGLDADFRIALLHYSPCVETLAGEPFDLYPFLGSHLLGEAIDRAGADLAFHGHAHAGRPEGMTLGGTLVRNVAVPVIGHAFRVFRLASEGLDRGRVVSLTVA